MRLKNPVKDFKPTLYPAGDVTQWFGENKELYSKAVCYGGMCLQGHNGIDIVRPWGEPIFCVSSGVVVEANEGGGFGNNVRILSDDSYEWQYAHLSKNNVVLGQRIEAGQQIGNMGNTGFVVSGATPYWNSNPYAGTHLHLGVRKFIPYTGTGSWTVSYATGVKGNIENYGNGFFGALAISSGDFWDEDPQAPAPVSSKELTIQSLLNSAKQLEAQGKLNQAAIVRAVAGVVEAFWA